MIPQNPVRDWERQVYDFLTSEVPDEVRRYGERVVIDVLSATVAGATARQHSRVFREAALAEGAASVLGTDRRVDPAQAALMNVTAAITPEMEEGHNRGGHVGASIVAGAVGVAEANDVDGSTFVDACIRSYELCARLEYAIFAMKARINDAVPWLVRDPHSTWTTVGPALTAAVCLGLDADGLRETFRTAANLAVVSMCDPYAEGAPSRNFTAGFSAQAGVSVATCAAAGLRGSAAAIEAVYDPFEDLLADGEFEELFSSLGTDWWITEAYHKQYPSCRYTHAPLDAFRDALGDGDMAADGDVAADEEAGGDRLTPDDIERIDVYTYRNGVDMSHARPATMTAAKFSTPYVLARWVADRELTLQHFLEDALKDESVQSLTERVHFDVDEKFEAEFPDSWGARVEIRTRSGETHTGSRRYPSGDYRDPLTAATFEARTRALLEAGISKRGREDDRVEESSEREVDEALQALKKVRTLPVSETVRALRL